MKDIIGRIFPLGGQNLHNLQLYHKHSFSPISTTLIIGRPHSNKTAMLMQAAITEGATGRQVLFIAPSKITNLPLSVHGMFPPTSATMKNIQMLYATTLLELQGYLASLHLMPRGDLPSLIVIDDLQSYVPINYLDDISQILVNVARILSLIQEAAGYCQDAAARQSSVNSSQSSSNSGPVTNSGNPCGILMSWTNLNTDLLKADELKSFARDYCHNVWTVRQLNTQGSSTLSQKFEMEDTFEDASCNISFTVRKYSSMSQDIVLQKVVVEREGEHEETSAS
ncbi:uncharacterized protein LOC135215187 [Macrobrachium nipponense]|uniref:uncharacterized protein LOC135215187 n=1 Tax=Macrobrachium nipponense TaxID=159736 RepID=UPI0030C87EE5